MILIGKQAVSQLAKKFPAFVENRKIFAAFISARYLFLPWAT